MDWVRVNAVINRDRVKQLDSLIEFPVSRSQVIDAILEYSLRSPEFIKAIIDNEREKIERMIQG